MDFITEMNKATDLSLDEFKAFINRKLKQNKDFLEQLFWFANGTQMTVLNYLIEQYQEPEYGIDLDDVSRNLIDKIDLVLELSQDANVGEPVHQAILTGKIKLALHLLQPNKMGASLAELVTVNVLSALDFLRRQAKEFADQLKCYFFDVDRRDTEGRTLLSLALDNKDSALLVALLAQDPNLHAVTNKTNAKVKFQPIHQAVVLDYTDGVRLLAKEGANLTNPMGAMMDTPVLLAARSGTINALEALMEFPVEQLMLETENCHFFEGTTTGHTAIEEFCERIANHNETANALRGVAILLCHGAEPPRNDAMRNVLSNNRVGLLKAIHRYLENKPELVDPFVTRCHLTESALHYIIYADHSWGSSIRHLLGMPSNAAFMVEDLVVKKYSNPLIAQESAPMQTTATVNLASETSPLKLYAEFVRRYNQAYESQLLPNRWSTMRWMIAEGRCDWATVKRYSDTYPTSRTRIILREMFNPIPPIQEEVIPEPDLTLSKLDY
ncbi:Dot/Icm T4SS effector AnkC/LegA12 [uncultured Legionella sp.]|uniref:Dot/Icm T4SS effector AnkC/LegA12 n=1 Tax=uncultured Legionella sp. TaxID=210934 RepID=UPI002636E2C1|nr:Dot/Icm T4SS effector AnkC/LegA12 [uncultured Legionella sp.]